MKINMYMSDTLQYKYMFTLHVMQVVEVFTLNKLRFLSFYIVHHSKNTYVQCNIKSKIQQYLQYDNMGSMSSVSTLYLE